MTDDSHLFDPSPVTDRSADELRRYPPSALAVTVFGPSRLKRSFVHAATGASNTIPEAQVMLTLAKSRNESGANGIDSDAHLLRFALPQCASLCGLAADLAREVSSRWPDMPVVMIGSPHRGHRFHQVAVIDDGVLSYHEHPADANDTRVIVGGPQYPWGLLMPGRWYPTSDYAEPDWPAVADYAADVLYGAHGAARLGVYIATVGGAPRADVLADGPPLQQVGPGLFAYQSV